ncbi:MULTISPECIES: hypothetical protein [Micromonospora]|uniref:hypothetical protein n=1 Tax=Micromonospora TaxID=1873 RepID=UPI00197B8059|nr:MULTISPECIES: hypothetical protein [Micromonospora]
MACAGALWGPAEKLLLYDFSRPGELPSAVRLNATFRSLGQLCGPVVGSVLLLLGPSTGILLNVTFYLPLTLCLRSFFVGASLQSTMPAFAEDLDDGHSGTAYGVLLLATVAGGGARCATPATPWLDMCRPFVG